MKEVSKLIKKLVLEAGSKLGFSISDVHLEHPDDLGNGDYSTNIALVHAKNLGKSPREIADELHKQILGLISEGGIKEIQKVEVAGAGFINFYLSREFFAESIREIIKDEDFGKGNLLQDKTALFEYTDPNPFKAFHIGHLMANAVGETLSRIGEFQGASVKRICYQGDIGLHVAKTVWAMKKMRETFPSDDDDFDKKVKFMGDAYVLGTNSYEDDQVAQNEIKDINKKIFDSLSGDTEKSDTELQNLYSKGRQWSLDYFESIYKILDTKFDDYIFESEVSDIGKQTVENNIPNIFTKSEGAVIFRGEDHGLHTRVFLNSQGLPTYEAKELGNAMEKSKRYKFDVSIITSANEISDYFKVLKCVMALIDPENAKKTHFVSHGMLRFSDGKMSSRKGNIITGESLISEIKSIALGKINGEFSNIEKNLVAQSVAIAAIKYSILKQSPGKDVIFDKEKALSFEGDSGPYLQYANVRACSIIDKAVAQGMNPDIVGYPESTFVIEKFMYRFEEVAARAWEDKSPQLIVEYLTVLAGAFNNFYAQGQIISKENDSAYKLAITKAFSIIMKNGLNLLAIPVLKRM